MANRIKVNILGTNYYISTDCSEDKMRVIEQDLEEQLKVIQDSRPSLSKVDVLVVLALNLMDKLAAGEESVDRMREQLTQYLEDSARGRVQLEEAQQEVARLTRELARAEADAAKAERGGV